MTVVKRGQILGRSVRTSNYRYTEWDDGKQGYELYDHTTDPGEWVNLTGGKEPKAARAELSALIKRVEKGTK